jgi:glycosyltransferase involved in cell wall biosynthesis
LCSDLLRRAGSRVGASIPKEKVTTFTTLGVAYALATRLARFVGCLEMSHWLFSSWFARKVAAAIERERSLAIYGFNTASLEIFQAARRNGVRCILEQTIVPKAIETNLLEREFSRWPEWEDAPIFYFSNRLAQREAEEWKLADLLLCGSEFVIDSLASMGIPREKCLLVPYGYEISKRASPKSQHRRFCRILFAGSVNVRKGVPYLYHALRQLQSSSIKIEAKIAGPVLIKPMARRLLAGVAELLGNVPRDRMHELYEWADIFVLPSICEGSATVTYEALAHGVPVITTPNAGSIVRDGIDGFIVPICDVDALADRIGQVASNPELRWWMSANALERAREEGSLHSYGKRLMKAISLVVPEAIDNM